MEDPEAPPPHDGRTGDRARRHGELSEPEHHGLRRQHQRLRRASTPPPTRSASSPTAAWIPSPRTDAAGSVKRLFAMGTRVLKLHPPHQAFAANDYTRGLTALGDIYQTAEDLGMPVLVHTGTSIFPGARCKYGNPMELDDVAIDFPELRLIMAHGGRPLYMAEAFFVLRRHKHMLLDLSRHPAAVAARVLPADRGTRDAAALGHGLAEPRRGEHAEERRPVPGAPPPRAACCARRSRRIRSGCSPSVAAATVAASAAYIGARIDAGAIALAARQVPVVISLALTFPPCGGTLSNASVSSRAAARRHRHALGAGREVCVRPRRTPRTRPRPAPARCRCRTRIRSRAPTSPSRRRRR